MPTSSDPLPALLAQLVDPDRLRLGHMDDGTGHCRVCTEGGQAGRSTFPCQLHGLANRAAHAALAAWVAGE